MKTISLLLAFITVGCASGHLRVQSEPSGADVYISTPGQAQRKLGRTPLEAPTSTSLKTEAAQITVSKEGYKTETVVVPASAFEKSANVDVKLTESKLPATCQDFGGAVQEVARGVAESQSYIQTKNLDRAEQTLNRLTEKFSDVSVLFDLLGNVHYLRRDLDRALTAYRKSITLNPGNVETARMIKKIEDIRGVKQ